jgi:hypothetical protein
MSLGTKNRQAQTAELCKQHLRDKYSDKLNLVEEYIREVEGIGKERDITRWGSFTDIKGISDETIKRVDERFEQWLNPSIQMKRKLKPEQHEEIVRAIAAGDRVKATSIYLSATESNLTEAQNFIRTLVVETEAAQSHGSSKNRR